jgi:hypothetical protein
MQQAVRTSRPVSATLCLICMLAFPAQQAAASGAFAVDDAEIDRAGACKVESWLSAAAKGDRVGTVSPSCTVDLGRVVEINPQFQRARSGGVWDTALAFQGKTNLLPVGIGSLGLALKGAPTFDFTGGQIAGGYLTVPATYQFSERFKININCGWLYERDPDWHWFTWGAGFEWKLAETLPLMLIGEAFGQAGHRASTAPKLHHPRAQLGLRYTPIETLDFDVIYGRNINGENAHWITVGLNVRFNSFAERTADLFGRR